MSKAQMAAAPNINIMQMLGMLFVLVLILALTYYATKWIARLMGGQLPAAQASKRQSMFVLSRLVLGKGQSVVAVCYDEKHYFLGISEHSVTLLDSRPMTEEELDNLAPNQKSETLVTKFSEILLKQIKKKDEGGSDK